MERNRTSPASSRTSRIERQLAPLKIISRLLGHELRATQATRLTLTREEVLEIQTSLDMFIEIMSKNRSSHAPAGTRDAHEVEVQPVSSRVN